MVGVSRNAGNNGVVRHTKAIPDDLLKRIGSTKSAAFSSGADSVQASTEAAWKNEDVRGDFKMNDLEPDFLAGEEGQQVGSDWYL
jgi:hypothetical protein